MKHESGIEVYLVPADGKDESMKYPELPYEQKLKWHRKLFDTRETEDEYNSRHNCCFVRHTRRRCNIVVRFGEDFETFSASAILIGVGIGADEPYWYHKLPEIPSNGSGEDSEDSQDDDDDHLERYRVKALNRKLSSARHDRYCKDAVKYVTVQRTQTVGQQVILRGPEGQGYDVPAYKEGADFDTEECPQYVIAKGGYTNYVNPGTLGVFVQRGNSNWLDENGKSRRDQSKEGPGGPLEKRPYQKGSFEHVHSKNGRKLRWEFRLRSLDRMLEVDRRNREKAGQEPLGLEELNDPLRYMLVRDEDYDLKSRQGQDYLRQLQEEFLHKKERRAKSAKPFRVRRAPKTCECPIKHTMRLKRCREPAQGSNDHDADAPTAKRPRVSSQIEAGASCNQDGEAESVTTAAIELTAPVKCSQCQEYKKPRKGKKFFWSEARRRWLLVPENGPDSFQPLPDLPDQQREDAEPKAGEEQQQTSAQTVRDMGKDVPAIEQVAASTSNQDDEVVDEQTTSSTRILVAEDLDPLGPVVSQTSAIEASVGHHTVFPPRPLGHCPSLAPDGLTMGGEHRAGTPLFANPAVEDDRTMTVEQSDVRSVSAGPLRLGGSQEQMKQPHQIVDLTQEDAQEIHDFKRERSAEPEAKHVYPLKDDTEDEDEAELRDIRLRREEIQLERRQAELERRMRQKAAAKQRAKVKQEVIELD